MKRLFLAVIATGLIFATSCKKNDDKINSPEISKQQVFFNKYGIQHNKVLTLVGEKTDFSKMKAEDRFNLASKLLNSYEFTWEDAQETFNATKQIFATPEKASKIIKRRESSDLDAYYDSLALIMNYCISDSNLVTPEQYNQMIAHLEYQIYNNFDVVIDTVTETGNEPALLLEALAISRYSYQFWYEAATDENNPWYDYINNDNSRGLWHAIKVAAADTWGALTSGWHVQNAMPPITWNLDEAWAGGSKASSSVD